MHWVINESLLIFLLGITKLLPHVSKSGSDLSSMLQTEQLIVNKAEPTVCQPAETESESLICTFNWTNKVALVIDIR